MELTIYRCVVNQEKSIAVNGKGPIMEPIGLTYKAFTSIGQLNEYYREQFKEVTFVEQQTETTRCSENRVINVQKNVLRWITVHDSHIRMTFDVIEETLEVME